MSKEYDIPATENNTPNEPNSDQTENDLERKNFNVIESNQNNNDKKDQSLKSIESLYESCCVKDAILEIYWVDQKEWREANVTFAWSTEDNQYYLHIHFPNHPEALDEELNLSDPSIYKRVRIKQINSD